MDSLLKKCYKVGHEYESVFSGSSSDDRIAKFEVLICMNCGEIEVGTKRLGVISSVHFHLWNKKQAQAASIMSNFTESNK